MTEHPLPYESPSTAELDRLLEASSLGTLAAKLLTARGASEPVLQEQNLAIIQVRNDIARTEDPAVQIHTASQQGPFALAPRPIVSPITAKQAGSPTALRIMLGAQLRKLRTARGLTHSQAGDSIRASHTKIIRMESGRIGVKERDIADLLTLYQVLDSDTRSGLLELARATNGPGWWSNYSDIMPNWFENYIGLEEAASQIRAYEIQFVPGLLQTEGYARARFLLRQRSGSCTEIDRRVELRMDRQKLLTRDSAPHLWVIVDEAALLRPVGGPMIMREQLEYLIEVCRNPNVTIQIIPLSRGSHSVPGGPFIILHFAEQDIPGIVYVEQLTTAIYLDNHDDVEHYLTEMDRLRVEAEPATDTPKILTRILNSLNNNNRNLF